MNKVTHFIITNECLKDQLKARRHHPSLEITFRDKGACTSIRSPRAEPMRSTSSVKTE